LTTGPPFSEEGHELLKEYAESYFRLHLRKEDGTSEAESLARILDNLKNKGGPAFAQQRNEIESRLHIPDMPEEYMDAWKHFMALHRSRGGNGFGVNPLSYTEIDAYIRLTHTYLLPDEIIAIQIIDAAYLKCESDLRKAAQKAKGSTSSQNSPPNPAKAKGGPPMRR
jgi:hypothetical protein